jgi:hypothetical protein
MILYRYLSINYLVIGHCTFSFVTSRGGQSKIEWASTQLTLRVGVLILVSCETIRAFSIMLLAVLPVAVALITSIIAAGYAPILQEKIPHVSKWRNPSEYDIVLSYKIVLPISLFLPRV